MGYCVSEWVYEKRPLSIGKCVDIIFTYGIFTRFFFVVNLPLNFKNNKICIFLGICSKMLAFMFFIKYRRRGFFYLLNENGYDEF